MAHPTRSPLLGRLRRGVRAAAAKAGAWLLAKSLGERVFSRMLGGWGFGTAPGAWSGNRVEQVQHYRHWVYRAIGTIQTLATKEPPAVVAVRSPHERERYERAARRYARGRGADPGHRRFLGAPERAKALGAVKPHEELEHLPDSDALAGLLKRPNEWDTGGDLWRELLLFLELTGSGYLWTVPYANAPGVAELWVIPSHWVWPQSSGKGRIVDYYEVRPLGPGSRGVAERFEPEELIHFRYKSPVSKVDGQSPVQAGAEVIDSYESVQLARFFSTKNGANVGTVFQCDASYDPDDDTIRRWEAKLFARFQGEWGFDRPAVLPPGMTLVPPPPERELAFLQSADQLRDYVLGLWGITKSVAGFMDDVNRAAWEAALAQCYYLVVNPRLSHLGEVLTERVAARYSGERRVFWADQTPADRQAQLAEWNTGFANGAVAGNEYRGWMNLEPLPGLDAPLVPMGLAPGGLDDDIDDDTLARVRDAGGARKRFSLPVTSGANGHPH